MKNIFITLLLFQFINLGYSQNPDLVNNKYSIESDALNETRDIWIGLPTNYDSSKSYPTIYVMDAEWQFDISFAIMKELAVNDKIPSHIVIGIPHIDYINRMKNLTFTPSEFGSNGELDSLAAKYFCKENTEGGMTYYTHLTKEVVPFVDSIFKTNGFDVFIGHSLSGYYGAYILTMNGPFNAFQLYDPSVWYNQGDAIEHFLKTTSEKNRVNVFISTANAGKDRAQYNVEAHKKFHDILVENKVNSELKVYDEDHGSVRLVSLIDGLSNLYKGYSIGYISVTDTITVQDVQKHYREFSEKVNYAFEAPADIYRWVGFANHFQGKWDKAIEAYQLCSSLYAVDVKLLNEFADSYFQTKEYQLSADVYKKVLALDQSNEIAKQRIEKIKLLTTKNKKH
jgi:predicted alpha/beta superfamily hydrolase